MLLDVHMFALHFPHKQLFCCSLFKYRLLPIFPIGDFLGRGLALSFYPFRLLGGETGHEAARPCHGVAAE